MNFDLRSFFEQLIKAPARTKIVLTLSLLAVVAVFALGGYISGQPHFTTLYSNLGDQERVAVEKALAGAQIKFRVSQPPGPYVIYVDEAQYDQAQIAVALAEALKQAPRGIDAGAGGASTIFMSAGERAQTMQKREWQEAERLLEHLDFVTDATVTTSMPDSSPLRAKKPVMVSVALDLRGATTLTSEQARNVARLVMYRFGAPPENVMITDGAGRTLFDPSSLDDSHRNVQDLLDGSSGYDSMLAKKALDQIEAAYGVRKAVVSVTSQWNYDQSTIVDEKLAPEAVAVQTDVRTTQTPNGSSATGGPAGLTNASGFGNENAAVNGASGSTVLSNTKDEKKVFETSRQSTRTVRTSPRLERLFVSLVLDESLAGKREEVQKIVEAAVGFDKSRQDVIGVSTTAFVVDAPDETANEGEGEAAPEDKGPNRMLEMLLQRGVEIVSALGFLVLLFTSLKGGKKGAATSGGSLAASVASGGGGGSRSSSGGGGGGGGDADANLDPEALARAQIEELVRTDPRRVGEILSRWIDEKSTAQV